MLAANIRAHGLSSFFLSFAQERTRAVRLSSQNGAEDGIRTRDPLLGKEVLYH